MKKLSVLIALFLCVTIGGVYATWTYSGNVDVTDGEVEIKATIAGSEYTGACGTYTVTSNLILEVDQANDDHEAKLVFKSNNNEAIYLKIVFKPSVDADKTVKENAIDSELYFTVSTPMQYKMDADGNYDANGTNVVDIFTFANPSDGEFTPNITWTKEANGTFTATYDEAFLTSQISLTQTFVLDTKAEHDAFKACLGGNIVARVTDGVVS